jgi:hypothetical protein
MEKEAKKPEFTTFHIDNVWSILGKRFGFNVREWKFRFADYREELRKQRRDLDHDLVSDFFYFGNTVINPILNEILCRRVGYPTFNYLTEYVVTGKNRHIIKKEWNPYKNLR